MSLPKILSLATIVPDHQIKQEEVAEMMVRMYGLEGVLAKRLKRVYSQTQIDTRYTVLKDIESSLKKGLLSTEERNNIYIREAPPLALRAAKQIVTDPSAITHVVSVSCTGMSAPGIEYFLCDQLNLTPNVERLAINFMGCYGAIKGLAVSRALAQENPKNRILLVCTELCSIHMQPNSNSDAVISQALFGDGAAAAIIGCSEEGGWEICNSKSYTIANTSKLMTWQAGNTGFVMKLSRDIPGAIESNITPFMQRLVENHTSLSACDFAIHPGGKEILRLVQEKLGLENGEVDASWDVMRSHGNMSSPTVLFVLKALSQAKNKEWACGVSFGPGLAMEGILLRRCS